jgi:hypothetical protein
MRHLLRRGEVKTGVRTSLRVGSIEGGAVADRDEDILKAMPLPGVVVHISGGNDRNLQPVCDTREPTDTIPVPQDPVVLKLHEDPFGAEGAEKAAQKGLPRSFRIFESAEEGGAAAPGQEDEAIVALEE